MMDCLTFMIVMIDGVRVRRQGGGFIEKAAPPGLGRT